MPTLMRTWQPVLASKLWCMNFLPQWHCAPKPVVPKMFSTSGSNQDVLADQRQNEVLFCITAFHTVCKFKLNLGKAVTVAIFSCSSIQISNKIMPHLLKLCNCLSGILLPIILLLQYFLEPYWKTNMSLEGAWRKEEGGPFAKGNRDVSWSCQLRDTLGT